MRPFEQLVICGLHGKHLSYQEHKRLRSGMSRFKKPFATKLLTVNLSRLHVKWLFPQNTLGENSITKNTNWFYATKVTTKKNGNKHKPLIYMPKLQNIITWTVATYNAQLTGKKLLAKISDEGAKANCFLSLLNCLLCWN